MHLLYTTPFPGMLSQNIYCVIMVYKQDAFCNQMGADRDKKKQKTVSLGGGPYHLI